MEVSYRLGSSLVCFLDVLRDHGRPGTLGAGPDSSVVAGVIADEKQRKTLHYLMASRLTSFEIVLGKLLARMLYVAVLLGVSLPVLSLLVLFGGIDPRLVCCLAGPRSVLLVSVLAFDLGLDHRAAGSRGIFHCLRPGMSLAVLAIDVAEHLHPAWPAFDQALAGLPTGWAPAARSKSSWQFFSGGVFRGAASTGNRARRLDDRVATGIRARSGAPCSRAITSHFSPPGWGKHGGSFEAFSRSQ